MDKKIPKIPIKEWIALAAGIVLFILTELALYSNGYNNVLINSIVSFAIASLLSYGLFAINNKARKLINAATTLISLLVAIPMGIILFLWAIPVMMVGIIIGLISTLKIVIISMPYLFIGIIKSIPKLVKGTGVFVLNIALVPLLTIYFTIYGMIYSLSGSTAKIMLRHYHAFGEKMIRPFKKHLHLDIVVFSVVMIIIIAVLAEVLNGIQTSIAVSASDNAYAMAGNGLSAMGTITSFAPVFIIVLVAIGLLVLLRYFFSGVAGFNAANA